MPRTRGSKSTTVPFVGVIAGTLLLAVAAWRYPGGCDWLDQSISSLFQPLARDGSPNAPRMLAAAGLVVCCASLGLVFNALSRRGPTPPHRKVILIGGVGSMVYAALVVTPMHDLLVWIAFAFFVTAMVTIFHWLLTQRRYGMVAAGIACLSLTLSNASHHLPIQPVPRLPAGGAEAGDGVVGALAAGVLLAGGGGRSGRRW